jgi:DNA-binding GntR family transcriptional regulator
VLSRGISPARKVIQTAKDQLDQVRFIDFGMPDQTAEMIVQHTVIFNAIRSGDTKIAVEEMDMHLQEVCEKQLSTKEC